MSQISISEQLAVVRAELNQGLDKYINGLADDLMRNENVLTDKIKRKDKIIKMLQAAYKKLHAEKKLLEKKLKNVELPTANLGMAEMKRLKEDIKILRAKNKAKQRKIRKFRLILDNISAEQYDDDPDEEDDPVEEDGIPSEDEEENIQHEDVEMDVADAEALLNEDDEDEDEDSDPDDSDFELNKADEDEGERDKKDTEEFIKNKAAEKADTDEENVGDDEADKDMDKSESEASVEEAEKKEVVKSVEAEETEKKEEECEINFTQTE